MKDNCFEKLPLDNAGKVFPGQNSKKWSNVFRLSVQLKEDIDPELLKKALKNTLERIPSFKVRIRNGFFSNYFERNEKECPVNEDIKNFCYRISFKENNGYLFRVYYYKSRISIDIYHALCDGYGGAVFLSTLAGEYLKLKGRDISCGQFVLDTADKPVKEEYEDAYERYCTSKDKCNLLETPAYHNRGTKQEPHLCNYTTVIMPFERLHAVSKSYGVTVTELLAAILLDIHYRKQLAHKKKGKDVSVQIPVNLRKAFPSRTVRNFVICLSVKMSPGKKEHTFEEILKGVSSQLRSINNKEYLSAYITQTVNLQTKTLKYVPLAIKNLAVKIGFAFGAEFSTSVLLSNLGPITLPEDMAKYVEKFCFYTGPGIVNGSRCGAVSFGDKLALTFSNRYNEDEIERELMKRLVSLGIPLTAETNRETSFGDIDGVTVAEGYSDKVFIP